MYLFLTFHEAAKTGLWELQFPWSWGVQRLLLYSIMEFEDSKLIFKLLSTPTSYWFSHYDTDINNICNIVSSIMGQSSKLAFTSTHIMGKIALLLSVASENALMCWIYNINTYNLVPVSFQFLLMPLSVDTKSGNLKTTNVIVKMK